jgi:AraC-like DNA-binding protein
MGNLYSYKERGLSFSHSLTEQPVPDAFRMHNHTNMELYCFLRGRGVYHIEGSEYLLEPGDVLLMHPSESHYIDLDCEQPYERIVLNFTEECLLVLDPEGWLLRPFRDRPAGKYNLYKSEEFPGGSPSYFSAMMKPEGNPRVNLLCGLLPLLRQICLLWQTRSEERDAPGETLQYRIIRYVNRNLTGRLTLDQICEKYYISKSQLCRLFKKATGTTLWNYVTVKRLALARELLAKGEQPTHIYSRCGFADYSTFYRAYTKHYGSAPAEMGK